MFNLVKNNIQVRLFYKGSILKSEYIWKFCKQIIQLQLATINQLIK